MKKTDRWLGLILFILGLIWVVLSLKLPLASRNGFGSGLLPLITGILMGILGLLLAFGAKSKHNDQKPLDWPRGEKLFRLAVIFGSLVIYIVVMKLIGFFLSTIIFFFVVIRFWGGYSWRLVFILSFSLAVIIYLPFDWLNVPLPKGLF